MSRPAENRIRIVAHVTKETARRLRKAAKDRGTIGKVVDWWASDIYGFAASKMRGNTK